MTWEGTRVVSIEQGPPPTLRIESPESQGVAVSKLKGPENSLCLDFKDGAAWASVRGSGNNSGITYLYRSLDFKTWQINATYRGENGRAFAIHHLDGKHYFLRSAISLFSDQDKCSPFAIAEIDDKGFLVLNHLINLDLKEPFTLNTPKMGTNAKAGGKFNPRYSALMDMIFFHPTIRYPGGLALVARRAGYIWCFDDQSGELKRSIKLFSGVTEEKLGPPQQLEWAILGCQPRPNGHLLVASREEEAVLNAMSAYPTQKDLKYLKDDAQQEFNYEQDAVSLKRWPRILWWDIDPKTGIISEEQPPQNVPSQIWDLRVFHNFKFRFKPDGNLLVN